MLTADNEQEFLLEAESRCWDFDTLQAGLFRGVSVIWHQGVFCRL